MSRRDILIMGMAGVSAVAVAACGGSGESTVPSPQSTSPDIRPTAIATPEATTRTPEAAKYPAHNVVATVFYIGEEASDQNAGIDNISTEWESHAPTQFGGVDDPQARTADGLPRKVPKENPFYFALPASEFDDNGPIKGAREASPWAAEASRLPQDDSQSLFKGRWVEVNRVGSNEKTYGQWLDTGPGDDAEAVRDYGYVFGDGEQRPRNQYGLKAGIDLSPTMAAQLGFDIESGSAEVTWHFVDDEDVPDGPWNKYPAIDNKTHWE